MLAEGEDSRAPCAPGSCPGFMFQLSCVQLKSRWDLRGSRHCLGLDPCYSFIRTGISLTLALVVHLALSCSPPVCEAGLSFLGWALV